MASSSHKVDLPQPSGNSGGLVGGTDEPEYEEEDEEYEDDDYYPEDKVNGDLEQKSSKLEKKENQVPTTIKPAARTYSQSTPTQKQSASVGSPSDKFKLVQNQNGKSIVHRSGTAPNSRDKVPEGFKGKIEEKKYHTRFLPSKHIQANQVNGKDEKNPDSYVTVTKSISGSLDHSKTPPEDKNFSSTYYTKSSTCGYFTFSCNIVYGSNGRSKICRPKNPNTKC